MSERPAIRRAWTERDELTRNGGAWWFPRAGTALPLWVETEDGHVFGVPLSTPFYVYGDSVPETSIWDALDSMTLGSPDAT